MQKGIKDIVTFLIEKLKINKKKLSGMPYKPSRLWALNNKYNQKL